MFSYIIGEVKHAKEDVVILENNNIGYKILMSRKSIEKLNINDTEKIYTEFVVREDGIYLYGFISKDELKLFLSLTSVSSVGPKVALSILSALEPLELKKALVSNDINTITKAPGVGRKTASRIILELSDKIDMDDLMDLADNVSDTKTDSNKYRFALEALINLGYNKAMAEKVLKDIDIDNLELSDIIKTALKKI
ncbi:MAG: Holliday junction branch migration protein RuvA [Tissierellia bacterium]|nr:Holliday junction branch migration protein RuvA [Tissierellia bacterium]